jgi:hypothetical protein
MPRRPLISARLPDELAALVAAKIGSTGLTQSEAVIEALRLWVGLPAMDGTDRLDCIEQRLSALEQGFTRSTAVYPVTAAIPKPSTTEQGSTRSSVVYPPKPPKPPIGAPVESTGLTGSTVVEADGGRWLTTSQGFAVAGQRGCDRSFDAFRSWSKRNPALCESQYQLRHISHGSRSNTAASFEDLGLS